MDDPRSPWVIEPLSRQHQREDFDCGVVALNEFLKKFARQNQDKGVGRTFVAVRRGQSAVCGYYTIAAGAVAFGNFPEAVANRLPRYPVPVVHVGRLAVNREARGHGLGETLLMNAMAKAVEIADALGIFAVEVVAKDEGARRFYEKYGFQRLLDDESHLYLSIRTIRSGFTKAQS